MSTHHQFFHMLILCSLLCAFACKQESQSADPSLDAWGSDTLTRNAPSKSISSGSQTQPTTSQKSIPGRNAPANSPASGTSGAGGTNKGNTNAGERSESGIQIPRQENSGPRWWDNRVIFFMDWVGDTGDVVYQAIKGQTYFPETRIFIYATDKAMEGTMNYIKTEETMKATELDDRIFIWVHLDDARKPIFVKKLISDNIKNKINSGSLKL
ncbi:MAG TPA: hypothetical protein VI603_12920 [Saprospiraceae bacterium]|nr:hypothetical protein [Saprospiraceae bacterium]